MGAYMACDSVKAVVLTPGIYNLDAPLVVAKEGFVILGLGMATLIDHGASRHQRCGERGQRSSCWCAGRGRQTVFAGASRLGNDLLNKRRDERHHRSFHT